MNKKKKKTLLSRIPAWVLSLIILFSSPFLLIVLAGFGNLFTLSNILWEIILCSFYPILISFACFLNSRTHPKSFWYNPIISNAYMIVPAILDSHFWIISFWKASYWIESPKIWMFHCSFLLSFIGAIIGARLGKNKLISEKA